MSGLSLDINSIVDKYLGREYDKHKFNCWTLVVEIYRDYGIEVPDYTPVGDFEHDWSKQEKGHFYGPRAKDWKRVEHPKPLDLIALKNNYGVLYHVGVMLNQNKFIHCLFTSDCCIADNWSHSVLKRFAGYYRHVKSPFN